jgi:excisionase family DNA binding protein
MAEKFVTFDDASKELKKSADELKALVDEGKIRSFMDGGKMKFRRKDLDDLKAALGIVAEDEDLALAPPDEVPQVPPMPTQAVAPAPASAGKKPSLEDEFTIEPLDDEPLAAQAKKSEAGPAKAAKPAAAKPSTSEDEVASLSDFEISEDVEDKGKEIGEEEAELLSVQGPAGSFRTFEEPQQPDTMLTVVLVASIAVIAFAAVLVMSSAWGVDIKSLSGLWPK